MLLLETPTEGATGTSSMVKFIATVTTIAIKGDDGDCDGNCNSGGVREEKERE